MPTFTPSPPKKEFSPAVPCKLPAGQDRSEDSSASPTGGKRQPTLFELRFGPRRAKSWGGKAETIKGPAATKREPSESQATIAPSGEDVADKEDRPGPSKRLRVERVLPEGPRPPSDAPSFLQVTRPGFVERYAVSDLPGADVYYQHSWVDARTAELWRRELDALPHWYRPKLKVYGREITQSRSIAAFSTEPGLPLKYSGHPVEMHSPFPPLLDEIAGRLCSDECLGREVRFNHAMLNRYEDGSIYIGKHSDNLENKVIVTVSLGAVRAWIMERRKPRGAAKESEAGPKKRWTLGNGSVLVMQGDTQRLYTHEIPKELRIKHPRISITFRQLVYD